MDSEVKASTKKSDNTLSLSEPHNDKHSAVNPGKLKKKEAADEIQSFNVESMSGTKMPSDNSKQGSTKLIISRRSTKGNKKTAQDEMPEQKLLAKKRRREKGEDGRRRKKRSDETNAVDNENWVQCERCMKWRLIPSVENLPEKWYCELNETDPDRNTCDAPQQTQEEVAKLRRKQSKKTGAQLNPIKLKRPKSQSPTAVPKRTNSEPNSSGVKSGKTKTQRSSSPIVHKSLSELTKSSDSGDEYVPEEQCQIVSKGSDEEIRKNTNDANDDYPGTTKIKPGKRNRQGKDDEGKPKKKGRKPKEAKQQEWVQCEKCDKWRRLPSHIKAKDLPDTWYCSMNTWDPRSASCAVQDDFKADTTTTNVDKERGGIMGTTQKTTIGSKLTYRDLIRKPTRPISERMRAAESIFSSHACEHDGEASGPPVVTYFNSSAFQHKAGLRANSNSNLNELSPMISEVSLFSLMRHSKLWKELYDASQEYNNGSEVISSSNMTQKEWGYNDSSSSSTSMKAMVHYALSRGSMSADEVLFECQCGDWKDLPWTSLRASCTIDTINDAIYELKKDRLIEEINVNSTDSDQIIIIPKRFRHVELKGMPNSHGLTPLTPLGDEENENSRTPMKFAKPWRVKKQTQTTKMN